ncbi:NAD(P)-dependent alcohol dehydrogenase [Marmoricola sp. URHB0036]|uniref:NAD(P)-dependent alcohol dehydrogenase n=1 Tax=Marmoricola sp. URHB0036 TaxID=1298863 RepID=UPI00040826F1|nr:NAD(P)-dependent alcohol dehydrogenase [Marmoricola sp. URHB0036]
MQHLTPTTPVVPETMRAITQQRYGSADTWHVARIAPPTIADDEVLVRTHAAGLDRGTWHLMTGKPYALRLVFGLRGPRKNPTPGLDVAGTVVAVGAGVSAFSLGDEVFGISKGSFAEYAAAKASKLAHKPAGLTFEQAAVVPVSSMAAWQAVHDTGRVEPGQRVLVIGASGGVGSYATQLAVSFGAEVTGVASTAKLDLVRSLGAAHVVDYTQEDWSDRGPFDVIIDIAGNPSLSRLRRALTPTGTAVLTGGEEGDQLTGGMGRQLRGLLLSRFVGQRLTGFIPKERGSDLAQVARLIDAGTVVPALDRSYPLTEAATAMRRLEAGEVRGKVAITVAAA